MFKCKPTSMRTHSRQNEAAAVVLISATSQREGKQAPKDQQQPRVWRVVITLEREGDQIKMSGVEFI